MKKLNKTEVEKYLKSGVLTEPFLDTGLVQAKIDKDFNFKIAKNKNYTKIESLYNWIHKNIKSTTDKDQKRKYKFQRTAKEIWESGFATGCTDYAILFATFARQVGIPTTFLHTAEYGWIQKLKKGEESSRIHKGHSFCECFYNGEWVLVDPTCRQFEFPYDAEKIHLSYQVGESNIFIPYFRGLDLGKRQTIEQHAVEEERACLNLNV